MSTDRPSGPGEPAPSSSGEHDPTGLDVARAVARSLRSAATRRGRDAAASRGAHRRGPELSGAHPDARDPAPVGAVIDRLIEASGWEDDVAVRSLFARWSELVGAEIAEHCAPIGFVDATVRVRTDSTAWATQLRLLAPAVVRRLNEELGHGTVAVLDVTGPEGPTWSRGRRSVRDGRGPRDTYG
jgi:predicted nucleic acid-binding Zn ribbon protein